MNLGNAKLKVEVDASGARSGVEDAKRAFDILKRQGVDAVSGVGSAFSKLKDQIFSIKGAIAGLGIGFIVRDFIQAGRETENYSIRLRVLLGSVEEGNRLFKAMNEYAARTPFEFREVMGAATQLAGVLKGGSKEIEGYMPLIADLAAASGLMIEEATGQVVRMLSAGASAADMFREKGINALLGFQTGVKYSAEETRKMLIAAWEDPQSKFRDAAKLLVNTWDGAMSNLADLWFQFQQRVMIDGGVMDYLKAIVQVLAKDFDGAFGVATGASNRFAEFTITALENITNGIGAVIEGSRFVAVAFNVIKTSAQGISNLWANLTKDVALANSEIATQNRLLAENSYKSINNSFFATEKEKLQAKQEYREALEQEQAALTRLAEKMKQLQDNNEETTKTVDDLYASYNKFTEGVDFTKFLENVRVKFEENKKASAEAEEKNAEFRSGLTDFEGPAESAANSINKPTKATEKYNSELEKLINTYDKETSAQKRRESALALLDSALKKGDITLQNYKKMVAEVNKEYDESVKKSTKLADSLENLKTKYISGYAALKQKNEAMKELEELQSQGQLSGTQYADILAGINKQYEDATKVIPKAAEETSAYSKVMENAATSIQGAFTDFFYNIFDKGVKSFKDLGKGILDIFKKTLAEMATLAIAKPIIVPIVQAMGGLFGQSGGGGFGQMIGQMFGGGGQGGTGGSATGGMNWGQMVSNFFGGGGGGASNGGGFSIMNLGSGIRNLFNSGMNNSAMQSYGVLNTPTGRVGPMGGTIGGYSTMGIGGALAGISYGLGRGDGGLGTAGSTVAGGLAGYGVGAAASAGLGVMAAGGSAAAAGTAALGAVPVAGWIALAALALDKLTGGKLFGTKYKTDTTRRNLSVGEEGGSGELVLNQSRQRSLFRGTSRRTVTEEIDEETQEAVDALFESTRDVLTTASQALGIEVPEMIAGTFSQVFDSKGKLKEEFSTIAGRVYKEGQEAFAQRLGAENIIEAVRQSSADASEIAERWRNSAEQLAEGAGLMLLAQSDINKGFGLLKEEGGLREVVDLVEDLANSGEDLTQAYMRLSQATSAFDSFIDHLGITLSNTREEVVTFAAAIAEAAGGLDKAQALYSSFIESYFTQEERRQIQLQQLQRQAASELEDLGEAGEGLNFENFRERFTEALPTLSSEEIVEWLQYGDAIARVNRALVEIGQATDTAEQRLAAGREAIAQYSGVFLEFQNQYNASMRSQTDIMRMSAEEIVRFSNEAQNNINDQGTLFGMLQDRYEMELSYLAMIRDAQAQINGTIDNSIERIRLSQMDDEQKYEYFRSQANSIAGNLGGMTDPEQIRRAVERIDALQNSAWGVMDEEGQSANAQEFIDFLEGVREIANERLSQAEEEAQAQNQEIAAALGTALDRFVTEAVPTQTQTQAVLTSLQGAIDVNAERMENAANRQVEAANTISDAADRISRQEIRVIIEDNRPEVGGGRRP